VTDGEETCDGDPAKAIRALQDKGIDITLNIVGFAIDDSELSAQFQTWAELGGGRYFSAESQEGLSESLIEALKIPYTIYDQAGTLVGTGTVDGDPVELDQGYYRVVVNASPAKLFPKVEVIGGQPLILDTGTVEF